MSVRALYLSNFGTELDEIAPFTREFEQIVDKMKEELVNEKKILEGAMETPDYAVILRELDSENELSKSERKEEEWKMPSESGSSASAPAHISRNEYDISSLTAELFNRSCPIRRSSVSLSPSSTVSSLGKWVECGCETVATSGYCVCMEQTISVPTAGTPSEEK